MSCYIEGEHGETKGQFKNFFTRRILIWSTWKIILILRVPEITTRRSVKI